MKLEKFEQDFQSEINEIKSLKKAQMFVPSFKVPTYKELNAKILSLVLALPAIAVFFGIFIFNGGNTENKKEIAMLEDSNTRLINQIDSIDYENGN